MKLFHFGPVENLPSPAPNGAGYEYLTRNHNEQETPPVLARAPHRKSEHTNAVPEQDERAEPLGDAWSAALQRLDQIKDKIPYGPEQDDRRSNACRCRVSVEEDQPGSQVPARHWL